jgi:beta-lactamase superfamily II metal-dependent hydrolase
MKRPWLLSAATLALMVAPLHAAAPLEIYWVDVEGGGGTLIVTPAKESILIDTGWPGKRDALRVRDAAAKSGVNRIDYLVLTHFHLDHFGGAADLAAVMPIGAVYDNGIPDHDPDGGDDARFAKTIEPYRSFKAERRQIVQPGDTLPLKQADGSPAVVFRFLAARQKTIAAPENAPKNPLCDSMEARDRDDSDNKNSVVSLVQCGPFCFFDGGDLTWNVEGQLVCPVNLAGPVDVFQVNHHGQPISNNAILVRSLAPTVSVMNNGARKGGSAQTVAALKSVSRLQAMYQVHRDVVHGEAANTTAEYIANADEKCEGNYIKLALSPDAKSYIVTIPATGHQRVYQTRE